MAGQRVCAMDGRFIGTVKEVEGGGFFVAAEGCGFWIKSDAVFTVEPARVTLVCNTDGIANYAFSP